MFEMSNDLAEYLAPGERVLWQGRSHRRPGIASGGGAIFLGIFMAVTLAVFIIFIAIASERGIDSDDARIGLVLIPIIFLAVGLGVGIPLVLAKLRFSNSRYVVTSTSAMVVSQGGWSGQQVIVVPLKGMPPVSLIENRDGTGTLVFGQNAMMAASTRYSGGWWMGSMPVFWNIERPLEVYQLIRRQMGGAS
jgi:hypothetical protein